MSTHKWPWPEELEPTPEELWQGLNEAPPEERRKLLEKMILNSREGAMCLMGNHDIEIRALRKQLDDARTVLSALAALIRAEHTPEEGTISDHGGQDTVTYCAGCGADLDEEECKYLVLLNSPQMHAYLVPPEPKVGDTVHYLGPVEIQSLSISSGPNAFGYSIELVNTEPKDRVYRVCRVCGCTSERACVTNGVPCHWVADTLCSACEAKALREGAS